MEYFPKVKNLCIDGPRRENQEILQIFGTKNESAHQPKLIHKLDRYVAEDVN